MRHLSTDDQRSLLPEGSNSLPGLSGTTRVLEFSGDGSRLMAGGDNKTVHLWDTSTWECLGTWWVHEAADAGGTSDK